MQTNAQGLARELTRNRPQQFAVPAGIIGLANFEGAACSQSLGAAPQARVPGEMAPDTSTRHRFSARVLTILSELHPGK